MENIYQLFGNQHLTVGSVVEIGAPYNRYGIIWKVLETDYKLPNPCFVSGPIKFIQQPINLYLIRGITGYTPLQVSGYVWGCDS